MCNFFYTTVGRFICFTVLCKLFKQWSNIVGLKNTCINRNNMFRCFKSAENGYQNHTKKKCPRHLFMYCCISFTSYRQITISWMNSDVFAYGKLQVSPSIHSKSNLVLLYIALFCHSFLTVWTCNVWFSNGNVRIWNVV